MQEDFQSTHTPFPSVFRRPAYLNNSFEKTILSTAVELFGSTPHNFCLLFFLFVFLFFFLFFVILVFIIVFFTTFYTITKRRTFCIHVFVRGGKLWIHILTTSTEFTCSRSLSLRGTHHALRILIINTFNSVSSSHEKVRHIFLDYDILSMKACNLRIVL